MADMEIRTIVDHEMGFTVYMTTAGRSLLKTSELTGVPLGTVRWWSTQHRWKDTADHLEHQARTANRHHILSELDTGMPTALATIKHLMTEGSTDKVKHDASRTWVELWGKYRDLVDSSDPASDDGTDTSSLSDAELFATLKREANR